MGSEVNNGGRGLRVDDSDCAKSLARGFGEGEEEGEVEVEFEEGGCGCRRFAASRAMTVENRGEGGGD